MKKKMRALVLSGAFFVFFASPAQADVKAGVDDWSSGNFEAAVKEWRPLADKGDPDAQFNLAQAYKLGRGVPLDIARAEELYGKAAAQGHLQAADTYGLLLFQRGERQSALPYIMASAARGDARAQYILGVAHFNGDIVAKDWVRAYALVSLAQQAGLPQATNALNQMNEHIPLADRQKSVPLAARLSAEAQGTRERLATAADLGMPATALPSATPAQAPQIASASQAVAEATMAAESKRPGMSESIYALGASPMSSRPVPPPVQSLPTSPPRSVAARTVSQTSPASPAATGPWRVQLGAFGVAGNADALWKKLRNRPELSGRGKLTVPAGKLIKLQAGGFASKAEADAACSRLSAGGFACLPVHE